MMYSAVALLTVLSSSHAFSSIKTCPMANRCFASSNSDLFGGDQQTSTSTGKLPSIKGDIGPDAYKTQAARLR